MLRAARRAERRMSNRGELWHETAVRARPRSPLVRGACASVEGGRELSDWLVSDGTPPRLLVPTLAQLLRRSALFGVVGSLALHATSLLTLLAVTTPPPPAFELTFPIEVELGMTEATEVSAPAPPPEASEPVASGGSGAGSGAGSMDAGVPRDGSIGDGGSGDGSIDDAGRRRRRRDAGVDGGAPLLAGEGEGAGGDGDSPVAFLPAGAQVALRADLDLARASPVRDEVEELLAALPDWRILLGSSGVDPVRDFSRVLIATPNFDRSRLVVAGRIAEAPAGETARSPREMADALAAARGEPLAWTETEGIESAPWNVDATPRTLAIVGPRHFVVARDEDIARVLQIAASRRRGDDVPADSLLSMREREALSLEVEGVRHFARRSPCLVPQTLRIGMTALLDESGVGIEAEARFDDEEGATSAAECLDDLREQYATNFLVLSMGLGGPLSRLEIVAEGPRVLAHGGMTYPELQRILNLLRGFFVPRSRPAPSGAEPPPVEPSGTAEPIAPAPDPIGPPPG